MTDDPVLLAWAAGLFEGEGSCGFYSEAGGKRPRIRVSLGMTDRDVVERFAVAMGCGSIYTSERPTQKAMYQWAVTESEKVRAVLTALLPYMGVRRCAKAEQVLRDGAGIRIARSKRTCCLHGHPLSGGNLIIRRSSRTGHFIRRCRACQNAANRRYRAKSQT